jgi:dihydroorotate dehydrogenase (fumarate)
MDLTTTYMGYEYTSVQQMQSSMSQQHCADPSTFERTQYMRALKR